MGEGYVCPQKHTHHSYVVWKEELNLENMRLVQDVWKIMNFHVPKIFVIPKNVHTYMYM